MYIWFTILHYLMIPMNVLSQCVDEVFSANNFYAFVSTKTDYDFVHGNIQRLSPECQPIQAWMIMRHGTRHAGVDELPALLNLQNIRDQILKNHKKNHGCLRPEKLQLLKSWKPSKFLTPKYASAVASVGLEEAERFGSRIRSSFPEFVVRPYQMNPNSYWFRTTNNQRTMETLKAFAKGFLNQDNLIKPEYTTEVDIIVQPHKSCPAWDSQMENCNVERDRFAQTPVFQRFAYALTIRLGYNGKLTFHEIYIIYSMCRYEYAWNKKPSIWCMIFTVEEMKIMEYAEDLSYYYSCGPSCPLAGKLGCFALNNMFHHFELFEKSVPRNYPKIILYGGHTISINLLMMALKTHQNFPLKAINYESAANREYRSSLHAPFLANILAVFHKCKGHESPNKVVFYQNEQPLTLSYCGNSSYCDWQVLKAKFQRSMKGCNLEVCSVL